MSDRTYTPALAVAAIEDGAREALSIWQCGYDACADYMIALAASRGPGDLVTANAELLAANVNIFRAAAGALLRRAGVSGPTLNDA